MNETKNHADRPLSPKPEIVPPSQKAPKKTLPEDDHREIFEKWASDHGWDITKADNFDLEDYLEPETEGAWIGFEVGIAYNIDNVSKVHTDD
jgi:hypothetical protein